MHAVFAMSGEESLSDSEWYDQHNGVGGVEAELRRSDHPQRDA